jgi:hypothetical protein
MREIGARNLQLHRLGAGRKQQCVKFALLAVDELDSLVLWINRLNPGLQQKFDRVLFVEILGAERNNFFARTAIKKVQSSKQSRSSGWMRGIGSILRGAHQKNELMHASVVPAALTDFVQRGGATLGPAG